MSDRLDSSMEKVKRAKKHIRDLDAEVRAFFNTNPYVVGTKRNPETRQLIYYLVSVRETPLPISAIAGDVLQNLRSALDHLAYQLVRSGLRREPTESEARNIAFPIARSAQELEPLISGKVKGASRDAMDAIKAMKPYKGGNDALWRIHSLNTIDKHRLLITVGSAFQSVEIGALMQQLVGHTFAETLGREVTFPQLWLRPADRMCPLKVGDELFIDAPDAEVNEKMQFRFDIAFGEPQIAESDPLLETLQHMLDLVDNLIPSFRPCL